MHPITQATLIILGTVLTFIFGMIAVYLQRNANTLKEIKSEVGSLTTSLARMEERENGRSSGCTARHIELDTYMDDHEKRLRSMESKRF